ncbi:MAG: hypothetical protein HZA20_04660 [Nitrospirae bacterium]|nr:hypothetical protein [Nitrospirota bacterium]
MRALRLSPENCPFPSIQGASEQMISRTISKFIQACIVFVAVIGATASCHSADSPSGGKETLTTEWREVMTFSPVALGPPAWCGKDALVVKEYTFTQETNDYSGGIVHIDLASRKKTWIERDPMNKTPSCSHDGSIVFYSKIHPKPQVASDGTFEITGDDDDASRPSSQEVRSYNLKSGMNEKVAQMSIDFLKHPASPTANIFALVTPRKENLKQIKVNLPGWKLVTFPTTDEERNCGGDSQWSTSGKFLVFDTESPQDGRHYAFYDANGVLIRRLADTRMNSKGNVKALDDGMYFFRKDGQLMRFDPWADKLEELPLKIEIRPKKYFRFDISPKKEIAYIRHDKNGELWSYSLTSKQDRIISVNGGSQSFSPDGRYLGIIIEDSSGNGTIAIMQRFER